MLKRAARYGVLYVLAISGLVIVLRMLCGPFSSPVRVRTPLNPEGWFGLAFTLQLAMAARDAGDGQAPVPRQSLAWTAAAMAALAVLTCAAFWRTPGFYFLSDDFITVKLARSFQFDWRQLLTTPGGDGFFRPVGNLSLGLTSLWAGMDPAAWHLAALMLHFANVVLVFLLSREWIASRLAASFAAALFAIHGTRPEAVVWISGRFDLVATFFVLAGLCLFLRALHSSPQPERLHMLAALLCMVLAILSKESAYAFPLLLLLVMAVRRDWSPRRIAVVIPFFLSAALLFGYRWWLFGGIGGYRDAATGRTQALTFGLATLKALLLRVWAALYYPINWSTEPGAWMAGLMLLYLGVLVWLAWSHSNPAGTRFACGFVVLSALPPLHLLGIGAGLENARLLYLPSVGVCLLLGVAVDGLRGRLRWILPGAMLAFHLAALHHNLQSWEYAASRSGTTCAAVVSYARRHAVPGSKPVEVSGLPRYLKGVPVFANGFAECLEMENGGIPVVVRLTGNSSPPAPSRAACALVWDETSDGLRTFGHPN